MTKRSKLRILRQQIAYDIRQGIIYQWKKYAMLLIVYIVCIVSFIIRWPVGIPSDREIAN